VKALNAASIDARITVSRRAEANYLRGLVAEYIQFDLNEARTNNVNANGSDASATYLNALGRVDTAFGNLLDAEKEFESAQSAPLHDETLRPVQLSNSRVGLAWINIERGLGGRAVKIINTAIRDAKSSTLPPERIAQLVGVRAVALWKSGDFIRAEADFRNAIGRFEQINKTELRERLADCYNGYAAMLTEEYRLDEAFDTIQEGVG
jgi:tetratricopeptide (TPR) repeat protein